MRQALSEAVKRVAAKSKHILDVFKGVTPARQLAVLIASFTDQKITALTEAAQVLPRWPEHTHPPMERGASLESATKASGQRPRAALI